MKDVIAHPPTPETPLRKWTRRATLLSLAAVTACAGSHLPPGHSVPPEAISPSDAPLSSDSPDASDFPTPDQLNAGYNFVSQLDPKSLDGALVNVPNVHIPDDAIYKKTLTAANLKIAEDFAGDVCDGSPYPAPTELDSIDDNEGKTSVRKTAIRVAALCLRAEAADKLFTNKYASIKSQLHLLGQIDSNTSLSLRPYRNAITALQKQAKKMSANNLVADDYVGDRVAAWRTAASNANDSLEQKAAAALNTLATTD